MSVWPHERWAATNRRCRAAPSSEVVTDAVDNGTFSAPVVRSKVVYWLVGQDGGIFAFGDAPFAGSTGNMKLNKPIVGMAPSFDGKGYWLMASDGGVFAFKTAQFLGSMGATHLNRAVNGVAAVGCGSACKISTP